MLNDSSLLLRVLCTRARVSKLQSACYSMSGMSSHMLVPRITPWRNAQAQAAPCLQHLASRCHAEHGSGLTCAPAHAYTTGGLCSLSALTVLANSRIWPLCQAFLDKHYAGHRSGVISTVCLQRTEVDLAQCPSQALHTLQLRLWRLN